MRTLVGAMLLALVLVGCGTVPVAPGGGKAASSGGKAAAESAQARGAGARRGGAYYLDDGPGDSPPADLHAVPDAVPRAEPLHPFANRPYRVFGVEYVPRPALTEHRERGVASWYGRKFHGRRTSSGEPYDMYGMTAAHPTLPIPSYVRVTHLGNGRSVVVRVNDRGPFLRRRVIDLSYTAAYRLGYVDDGHAEVEVELLSSPSAPGRAPLAAPLDVAKAPARSDAGRPSAQAVAPAVPEPAAPVPMLAEAVAAERLSFETLIDDRPLPGAASSSVAASSGAASSGATSSGATSSGGTSSGGTSSGGTSSGAASSTVAASSSAGPPGTGSASAASSPVAGAGTVAARERGTWLQIGAFASRGNAEAARARVSRESPWLAVPVDVLRQGDTWRVQAGPWTSREDALAVAARIASNGVFRPIPVVR